MSIDNSCCKPIFGCTFANNKKNFDTDGRLANKSQLIFHTRIFLTAILYQCVVKVYFLLVYR